MWSHGLPHIPLSKALCINPTLHILSQKMSKSITTSIVYSLQFLVSEIVFHFASEIATKLFLC